MTKSVLQQFQPTGAVGEFLIIEMVHILEISIERIEKSYKGDRVNIYNSKVDMSMNKTMSRSQSYRPNQGLVPTLLPQFPT